MIYDSILLLGIFIISLMPAPILSESFRLSAAGTWLTRFYLVTVTFIFFGWFWIHRGQTLGMRAWRIKLISEAETPITWLMALKRFLLASVSLGVGGAGYLWSVFHPQNMTFHDLYSGSKLVLLKKQKKLSSHPSE